MPIYLTNVSKDSTLLIKEGKYEVKSGHSIPIGKTDVDQGVFEEVVNKGLAKIVKADELPAPMYEPEAVPYQKSWSTTGMNTEEVSAYLAGKVATEKSTTGSVTSFGRK
jgi:hypothetical protein